MMATHASCRKSKPLMSKHFRMYAGADGETHFADMDVAFQEAQPLMLRAPTLGASSVTFNVAQAGLDYQWHTAPRRQFVVVLQGWYECVTSDGEVRRLETGDVMLAEDLTGKGHIMRVPGSEDVHYATIPLEDQTPTRT